MRRVPAVGNRDERGARQQVAHALCKRGELLVVRARDQADGDVESRQIRPIARLRARAEIPQRAGESAWTMRKPLRAELIGKGPQESEGRLLLPAVDELRHPFALDESGELVVASLPLSALALVLDAGRAAFQHELADQRWIAQSEAQGEARAHRIADDAQGAAPLETRERFVPGSSIGSAAMSRQVRRLRIRKEACERQRASGEAVQDERPHGGSPSAAITAACSARCCSTFAARSVRASTISNPAVALCRALRSALASATRANAAPQSRAAPSRSRPCGVANSSSNRSACAARGRKWKMPPPSLFTQTTESGSRNRAAATRPPRSCSSARSPTSATALVPVTAQAPAALEMIPSMPFRPRFTSTRPRRGGKASTSRAGTRLAT